MNGAVHFLCNTRQYEEIRVNGYTNQYKDCLLYIFFSFSLNMKSFIEFQLSHMIAKQTVYSIDLYSE